MKNDLYIIFRDFKLSYEWQAILRIIMKKHYVYLARCKDKTIYTGYTIDLKDREAKHNRGEGAKYTKYRLPVKIVYSEEFSTVTEAMKREVAIKRLSRIEKEELINTPS